MASGPYDALAASYEVARPEYPPGIFDAIETRLSSPTPRVIEVGPGTGQATKEFVARGWGVVAVEPSVRLGERLTRRLPEVTVVAETFEASELPEEEFDLVAAGTSWHWTSPTDSYDKAALLLRRRGVLALFWNAFVPDSTEPSEARVRSVYEDLAPWLVPLRLTPDRADYNPLAEVKASQRFTGVEEHHFPFAITYSTEDYLRLTTTYASHQALPPPLQAQLLERLRQVIEEACAGSITKQYDGYLITALRKE